MSEIDALWQHAPCAALRLWHDAGQARWGLNRAALEWSLDVGLAEPDWQQAVRALAGLGDGLDAG
ncbi:MAG TPA: hypothetical protein PLT38_12455, partial [Rubrivivax sp.]|nr:hypothetical protein [Rubrivivax sp.]